MNRRVGVKSLEDLCGERLRRYLADHCWTVAKVYKGIEIDEIVNREENLPIHIDELREAIFGNIAWYLDEQVVTCIVDGVYDAVKQKQSQYTINTKIPVYKTELYCMVTMIDLIVSPRLRKLDMDKLPRILRTHITSKLHCFTGVQHLNLLLLGFGVDSRSCDQAEIVAPSNIISALRNMSCLNHLILPNYCTNNIIKALSMTCRETLSKLEIDHSIRVSDSVVPDLLRLSNIRLLSMAGTSLTSESLAKILLGLPKLQSLPNADWLCDCLEWLVYESSDDFLPKDKGLPKFSIQEFTSSEDYHFHSKKQIEMVAKLCPIIAKVRFFYDSEMLCEIRTLEKFNNLRELCLNGGDFNKDPVRVMLESVGKQLTRLEFNHVDNIDRHAVVQMSICCTSLQKLVFSACSFLDYGALHRELIEYYNAGGLETNEEIELSLLLRDQEAYHAQVEGLIQPFSKLEELKISSQCSNSTLIFLLLHCPSLSRLYIGGKSEVSNETLIKILSFNPLLSLQELEISEADHLNRETFDILLNNCTNLRKVKGMRYWKGLSDADREEVRLYLKTNNLDLVMEDIVVADLSVFSYKIELSEEQKKFLSTA